MSEFSNGLLLVNKPTGITSHDVVARVRKSIQIKSVGHTGTLDPLASGLMVMLIGNATRLSEYFLKGNKGYRVQIRLGVETDSYDVTGSILKTSETSHLNVEKIQNSIEELMGHQVLVIPQFSAKKVNGVKLCDMVRAGEVVPEIEKDMFFYDLQISNLSSENLTSEFIDLSFKCSKGSFVRSWVHTLGQRLQCGAIVNKLERFFSEPYELKNALSLEDLEKNGIRREADRLAWVDFNQVLHDWPVIKIRSHEEKFLMNGQIPLILKSQIRTFAELNPEYSHGIRVLNQDNRLLSLLEKLEGEFKIKRVFTQQ